VSGIRDDDVLFGYRLQLFDYAARTSVSEACRTFGVHRADVAGRKRELRHLGFVNAALYRIGHSRVYHKALHDVTAGNNTVRFPPRTISGYDAAPGWDPVTGWGSPNARVLIPLLARSVHPDDGQGL
jgi:hypothetical protein